MRSLFGTIVCSVLFLSNAAAADADTAKTYQTNEVVVTATRTAINPEDAPAQVQVLTAEAIQGVGAKTVADALSMVSGVLVRDYGSETGMKNISIHGLSPTNVTVLLDGSPMNQALNGNVDLSLLPVNSIDHLEYMSGGASALYGGNALGGVINIVTRRADKGLHIRMMQELGSFDESRTAVECSGTIKGVGSVIGYTIETGAGDFPYTVHRTGSDTTVHQIDNDYKRKSAYWNGKYQIEGIAEVAASVQYVKFERGTPSIYSYTARLQDENTRFNFSTAWYLAPTVTAAFHGIYTHDDEFGYDPTSWTDDRFKEYGGTANAQLDWKIFDNEKIVGGMEYAERQLHATGLVGRDWLTGDSITQNLHPDRVQKSAYISSESKVTTASEWFSAARLFLTGRYDTYSDVRESAFSPKIGLNILLNKTYHLHVRSSWSKNFRVPTFNDLYSIWGSNPDLRPEHANTFDLGVLGSFEFLGLHDVQATYYYMHVDDKIAYALHGTQYLPYNIEEAVHQGIDVRYEYRTMNDMIDIVISGSRVEAEDRSLAGSTTYGKQLVLVPEYSGAMSAALNLDGWQLNLQESMVGSRYTDNTNTNNLPFYALTDITVKRNISLPYGSLAVQVAAKNIFNRDYQVYQYYPMPGRSFHVSLAWSY
jgi:vitamin B12 transporter